MLEDEYDPTEGLDDDLALEVATAAEGHIENSTEGQPGDKTELTLREIRAVQLRAAGADYNQIAKALQYANRSGAFKAVRRALQRWGSEAVEELRILELHRLDTITQKLWPQVVGSPAREQDNGPPLPAKAPDPKAMELYLKVSARRAKLLGLDAPTALELTGGDDQPVQLQVVDDYQRFVGVVSEIVDLEQHSDDGVDRADEGGGEPRESPADDQVLPSPAD